MLNVPDGSAAGRGEGHLLMLVCRYVPPNRAYFSNLKIHNRVSFFKLTYGRTPEEGVFFDSCISKNMGAVDVMTSTGLGDEVTPIIRILHMMSREIW